MSAKVSITQRGKELDEFVRDNRNSNTSDRYKAGWKQYERWVEDIENRSREDNEHIDIDVKISRNQTVNRC